jgi:3-deoxy-D-manno-octulosonic-acid transferase
VLLDTVGELLMFYSIADVCFVGGSLVNYGGHNILEPIYFSKPTIFGPYMNNFRDIERIVLQEKAAIRINTPAELNKEMIRLLDDSGYRRQIADNCARVFKSERNALDKNITIIVKLLPHETHHTDPLR